jgi:hypothetical protein
MSKTVSIENLIMGGDLIEPLDQEITNLTNTEGNNNLNNSNNTEKICNLANNNSNSSANKNDKNSSDFDVYIKGTKNITGRQTLLILPILKFFNYRNNLNKLIPILDGTSPISLRLIDWFVTNYCKKFNTMFNLKHYENLERGITSKAPDSFDNYFIVHSNYKGQLKTCNKKNFDPFCRRNRIQFYYEPKMYFETTVGQLNFFKWAIENYIVDYIADNIKDIEKDMTINSKINSDSNKKKKTATISVTNLISQSDNENNTKKKKKRSRKNSTRKKRKELSTSASRTMFKHNYPTVISFD